MTAEARSPKLRALTLTDQALSSLTNFVPGLYAAKVLSPRAFGILGLITLGYILMLGMTRAALSEVAIVGMTDEPVASQVPLGAADATAAVATVVAIAGTLILALNAPRLPALLVAVGVAVMLVQDSTRMLSIGIGKPMHAVVNDALWFTTLLILLPILHFWSEPTAYTIAAVWGLAALPGTVLGARLLSWRPRLGRGVRFLTSKRRLASAFLGDWSLKQGTSQLATYGIGLIGGLTTVAGIRAALLVLGPLNVVFGGLQLAALPAAVRQSQMSLAQMHATLRKMAATLGIVAIGTGAIVAALPESLLRLVVGEQAPGLSRYILPLSVALAGTGLMAGSTIGLRVLQATGLLVRARLITSLLFLLPGFIMVLATRSPLAGLWGLAAGSLLGVLVWERALLRAMADRPTDT